MISIQNFLNKSNKELELMISKLNQEEKYSLAENLLNMFEKNNSEELAYFYIKTLSKIEITEENASKLFKNKLASNNLLSFYLTINDKSFLNESFFLVYAKYIDISSENFVKLLTDNNHKLLLQYDINRQLLKKNFTEEQKKYIFNNFNQLLFCYITNYNSEEKRIFIKNIGFLPFLLHHKFETNNPDNVNMVLLIKEYFSQYLEIIKEKNQICERESKYNNVAVVHGSISGLMEFGFWNPMIDDKRLKDTTLEEKIEKFDIESYAELYKFNKIFHQIFMDQCEIYKNINPVIENILHHYLLIENF